MSLQARRRLHIDPRGVCSGLGRSASVQASQKSPASRAREASSDHRGDGACEVGRKSSFEVERRASSDHRGSGAREIGQRVPFSAGRTASFDHRSEGLRGWSEVALQRRARGIFCQPSGVEWYRVARADVRATAGRPATAARRARRARGTAPARRSARARAAGPRAAAGRAGSASGAPCVRAGRRRVG